MPECARCGAFTNNPGDGEYQYCDDCHNRFDKIRQNGVIVEQIPESGGYQVYVTADTNRHEGGTEESQADALARGKYLTDELSADGLFTYQSSGSQWLLEEYLQTHPKIRRDVRDRLSRVPDRAEDGLLDRLRSLF
ncbi:hypothetical protein ACFR9U_16265 [Halorientalis brevis]|uniref:Uncharacterized protein n=1 Tax=Halorientalis brevis TaxID=1126241 RepID=A0ABD6CGK2_9EURY|nr:hypothetical protein [Halorientalis brevis]